MSGDEWVPWILVVIMIVVAAVGATDMSALNKEIGSLNEQIKYLKSLIKKK